MGHAAWGTGGAMGPWQPPQEDRKCAIGTLRQWAGFAGLCRREEEEEGGVW